MKIESIDVVIYTAIFLIPGFMISNIIRRIISIKRYSESERIIAYIGYSLINIGCWYWLYRSIYKKFYEYDELFWLILIITTLITSAILGILIGLIKIKNPIGFIMSKLKIQTETPIPTAWESKFSQMNKGKYLTIALNDGTFIRGAFYNESIASSDVENKDIYLEKVFMLDNDNKWKEVENSDGIWIAHSTIKWISFFTEEVIKGD